MSAPPGDDAGSAASDTTVETTDGVETDATGAVPWWIAVYMKGAAMGAADTVPGVSGGTIALVVGVYERLVTAITRLDPRRLSPVLELHTATGRAALGRTLREMEVPFLLALGGGVLTAVVTLSRLLELALEAYRAPTFAFFFGLIAASALVLYGEVDLGTPRRLAVAALGVVAAFLLTDPNAAAALPSSPPVVFLAGAVAVTAMVLPGVSGSFLLLVLGQYEFMIGTLGTFVDGVLALATGGRPDLAGAGTTVLTFCAGAVVGLLTVAHVIRWALDHYRAATLTFLVSLMVGALRLPAREIADTVVAFTPATAVALLAAGGAGAGLVLGLDHVTQDLGL